MLKSTGTLVCSLAIGAAGCSSDNKTTEPPPTEALPQAITMVASGGFEQPGDAVSSHDGTQFFFTAFRTVDEDTVAAVLSTPAGGGTTDALHTGSPLGSPTGLVLSCDGQTLYVADRGLEIEGDDEADDPQDVGGIFAINTASGDVSELSADGISSPAGMALSVDCNTLYISGWDMNDQAALFTLPVEGGTARTVMAGTPLVSPTGLHVDKDRVAWVMDHLAVGADGQGVLFAIDDAGVATEVISNLDMGTPGGVSLNSSGTTAFIPTRSADGEGQLTSVSLADGKVEQIPAANMSDPAGIRTARNASVFVVVDSESGAIFSAK